MAASDPAQIFLGATIYVMLGACFGRDRIGRVSGLVMPMGLPFLLAMAPIVGLIRDATGSFVPGFHALIGVLAAAAALLLLVRLGEPERPAKQASAYLPR